MKITFLAFFLSLVFLMPSTCQAADMTCAENGFTCARQKLDFGAAQVTCYDQEHGVLSVWECEYELESTCTNVSTKERKITGVLPLEDEMCEVLCGACGSGWK